MLSKEQPNSNNAFDPQSFTCIFPISLDTQIAKCPCKNKIGLLTITETDDGTRILKCNRGCNPSLIAKKFGVLFKDLFPAKNLKRGQTDG